MWVGLGEGTKVRHVGEGLLLSAEVGHAIAAWVTGDDRSDHRGFACV